MCKHILFKVAYIRIFVVKVLVTELRDESPKIALTNAMRCPTRPLDAPGVRAGGELGNMECPWCTLSFRVGHRPADN